MEAAQTADIPIYCKYALSPQEAGQYFHLGEKKIRKIAQDHPTDPFVLYNGVHLLIIRTEFEKFLKRTSRV
jgi:hypothetical protein